MKKEISIKRLHNVEYIDEIISMHKELFNNTELYGKLIYFDEAYESFFKVLLNDENHFIFGVFLNNNICGFVHLRNIHQVLFLNNIYLAEILRGNGMGTDILEEILNMSFIKENNFVNIELDVLQSNIRAVKWYEKLGLNQSSTHTWYVVEKLYKTKKLDFKVDYDPNCFKSIFLNNTKVATIINNSYINLHDMIGIDFESNLPFIIKQETMRNRKDVNFFEFETSIRMESCISDIIKNINYIKNA